ncbi:CLUMA_CG014731, isoform A [Clunio marinus]|uniref:CLUMA_CG014731, isoform A n=1 Tax=Clunio marinus TaxID=568069 RepID=A0A1J1IP80_9DIPT|nr:CLUMA_CG014731, isoform A [Clunio marinus]
MSTETLNKAADKLIGLIIIQHWLLVGLWFKKKNGNQSISYARSLIEFMKKLFRTLDTSGMLRRTTIRQMIVLWSTYLLEHFKLIVFPENLSHLLEEARELVVLITLF